MNKPRIILSSLVVFICLNSLTTSFANPIESDPAPVKKNTPPARPHIHEELGQIKKWLESIERDTERRRITGEEERKELGKEKEDLNEEIYPIQSSRKTRIRGGLTFISQGITNNETQFGGDGGDASLSIDLIFESELRQNGLLIVRGDFMRGDGLTRHPVLFSGGVNADIEDFKANGTLEKNPDAFHLIEALYEQTWQGERFRFSFGQIDLTSYFDQNEFANSETFQFISPLFVNNAAIGWGGDVNGYGPGLIFHAHPVKAFELNAGLFEGDGNYENVFNQPFWIVEVEYERHGGFEGHYRFIYWSNETGHPEILNPAAVNTRNRGFSISFDQALSERFGVWSRFGLQDGKVSKFDHHVSLGLQIKNPFGRTDDVLGLAFGTTWISDAYHEKQAELDQNEYAAEIYYNVRASNGLHISPDLQYIANPGGNGHIDPITVYGVRAQLQF